LSLIDSTVTGNHHIGVALYGSNATLTRSVVRDTHEPKPRRWGAPGVLAAPGPWMASAVQLEESLVESNGDFGVYIEGGKATLKSSAVRDTLTRLGDNSGGFGIYVTGGEDELPTTLEMTDCQVSVSRAAGLYVAGAKAAVERCQVLDTQGDIAGYGDGIALEGASASLKLLDSLVSDSLRCGLLAKGAGGLVDRSMLTKGEFSIVVDQGAQLDIGDRMELTGNTEDRITPGENLGTPPPPVLPPPPDFPEP